MARTTTSLAAPAAAGSPLLFLVCYVLHPPHVAAVSSSVLRHRTCLYVSATYGYRGPPSVTPRSVRRVRYRRVSYARRRASLLHRVSRAELRAPRRECLRICESAVGHLALGHTRGPSAVCAVDASRTRDGELCVVPRPVRTTVRVPLFLCRAMSRVYVCMSVYVLRYVHLPRLCFYASYACGLLAHLILLATAPVASPVIASGCARRTPTADRHLWRHTAMRSIASPVFARGPSPTSDVGHGACRVSVCMSVYDQRYRVFASTSRSGLNACLPASL